MANIVLEDKTKDRLTKALGKMQSETGTLLTYSDAVSKLLDIYDNCDKCFEVKE